MKVSPAIKLLFRAALLVIMSLVTQSSLADDASVFSPTSDVVSEAAGLVKAQHLQLSELSELAHQDASALLAELTIFDPYAVWTGPADQREIGFGIGANLIRDGNDLVVVPLPGGPLWEIGVNGAHRLEALDGQTTTARDFDRVLDSWGQDDGKVVTLLVQSLENGWREEVIVQPSAYEPFSIALSVLGDQATLQIFGFLRDRTAREIEEALEAVGPVDTLIIDLRFAGGGSLTEAISVAGLFVPPETEISRRVDREGRTIIGRSEHGQSVEVPPAEVILLFGGHTASASEVLIRALVSQVGAKTMGRTSFGKCYAQSHFELADRSELSFTTHRLAGPGDQVCSETGIVPQIQVSRELIYLTDELIRRVALTLATGRWHSTKPPLAAPRSWPPRLRN